MTAAELLTELKQRKVVLVAEGNRLRYQPREAVPAELVAELRLHKTELLAMLRPAEVPPDAEPFDWLAEHVADRFIRWVRRQDARGVWGWERVNLPGGVAYWESCLEPDWDCPTCGGLLWWEDILGGKHCLTCERVGHERTFRLAERAARLRSRTAAQRPASGDVTAQPDPKHVDDNRPSGLILAGSGGCQDRQRPDTAYYGT